MSAAWVEAFLEMMSVERAAARNTLTAYGKDLADAKEAGNAVEDYVVAGLEDGDVVLRGEPPCPDYRDADLGVVHFIALPFRLLRRL